MTAGRLQATTRTAPQLAGFCQQLRPLASVPALDALRLRLAVLTRDAGHSAWIARALAHTRPSCIDLPAALTDRAVGRPATAAEAIAEILRWLSRPEAHGGLPREYLLGLLRRAGRAVRWPGTPRVDDVVDGLSYRPDGTPRDPERLGRHQARRGLAAAAAGLLAAMAPYVRDGRLTRLTWSRDQIRTEARARADAAERAAVADRSRWPGGMPTDHAPLKREWDAAWHRRQLRTEIGRTDGHVSWILGLTGGRPSEGLPSYCSRWTLARARDDAAAAAEWAANSVHVRRDALGRPVIGADGTPIAVSTADLVDGSRKARRAQLYAMCLATQELGERRGWTLAFATLTLPGEWHPNPGHGGGSYNPATTPQDARREQQDRWHRSVAMMRKQGIQWFAGAARELHRDGCLHSHVCAYVRPVDVNAWADCLAEHWPELPQHAGLPRADRVACQVRLWDAEGAASVASYLYGYASKSLDAADGDEDDDAAGHSAACRRDRVRRWSWVGFRRALVGDWQRVARERECPECAVLAAAWTAIRDRRYADALDTLGATDAAAPVVRDYEVRTNRYGEDVRQPHALRRADATDDDLCAGTAAVLRWRPHDWSRTDWATWSAETATAAMRDDLAGAVYDRHGREVLDVGDAAGAWPGITADAATMAALDKVEAAPGWFAAMMPLTVAVRDSVPRSGGCAPQARHRGSLRETGDDPGGGISIPPPRNETNGNATRMAA